MGMLNWIWDISQDSSISRHNDEIEQLTKRVQILEDWIRYYEQRGRPQETWREGQPETNQTRPQDENGQGIRTGTCIEEPAQVSQDKPV